MTYGQERQRCLQNGTVDKQLTKSVEQNVTKQRSNAGTEQRVG